MRPILAFDTSAAHCAAALYWPSGARPAQAHSEAMAKGQAERLLPMLQELLAAQGLVWGDLAAIAVGIGPGNFTGIRIAVALARGLSLSLGIPAIGVTGFDARAHDAKLSTDYWVTIAAPRGQVYAQRSGQAAALYDAAPLDAPVLPIETLPPQGLAMAIAQVAAGRLGANNPRPAPFYLRPADAAPSSEAPLVILP